MRIAAVFIACLHAVQPSRALAAPSAAGEPMRADDAGGGAPAPDDAVAHADGAPLDVHIAVALDPAYDVELADALRVVVVDAAAAVGWAPPAPSDEPGAPRVSVSVRWYEGTAGDIRVEYIVANSARADGSTPSPQSFVRRCETCDATMLVEKVRAEIGRVLRDLEPPSAPPAEPVVVTLPPPLRPARPPLSRLGWSGVGLCVVAAAPLTAGIVLVARGKREVGRDAIRIEFKDYRPAGLALVGAAAGLVVTGVVLLAVDRVRARRGSRRVDGGATADRGRAR